MKRSYRPIQRSFHLPQPKPKPHDGEPWATSYELPADYGEGLEPDPDAESFDPFGG